MNLYPPCSILIVMVVYVTLPLCLPYLNLWIQFFDTAGKHPIQWDHRIESPESHLYFCFCLRHLLSDKLKTNSLKMIVATYPICGTIASQVNGGRDHINRLFLWYVNRNTWVCYPSSPPLPSTHHIKIFPLYFQYCK